MPSQKTPFKHWDTYTVAPILIFQIQSYARLTAIESNVFSFIVLGSINVFGKNKNQTSHASDVRQWFYISPSDFAIERGYSRQGVQDALNKLVNFGFLLNREVCVQTSGGVQRGREYCLVSNEQLSEMYDVLSSSANPKGAKPYLAPSKLKKVIGARPYLAPLQAPLGTLASGTWHLSKQCLAPWGIKDSESLENLVPKDSLNTIKDFLNTFFTFNNSFYELHSSTQKSKTSIFKLEMKIAALIRQYGLFSTCTAMLVCLFNKNAEIGNIEAVEAFLKNNAKKFKEHEQNLILHCDNLFQQLYGLYRNLSDSNIELENFMEVFRQNASVLLIRNELERGSSGIFFYSDYEKDVLEIFLGSNWKMQRFTKEFVLKLELYLKIKLLGHKGLNFVQSKH